MNKYRTDSIFAGALILVFGFTIFNVNSFNKNTAVAEEIKITQNTVSRMVTNSIVITELDQLVKEEEKPVYTKKSVLEPEELKDLLFSVGFRGESLRQAWGVAMKESTGRPMAHNDNPATGDNSYGLFQINMIGSLGPARLEQFNLKKNSDLFDPVRNAEIAFLISDGGKDWSAWHGITQKTLEWIKEFPQ
jgi:hypothetical protein